MVSDAFGKTVSNGREENAVENNVSGGFVAHFTDIDLKPLLLVSIEFPGKVPKAEERNASVRIMGKQSLISSTLIIIVLIGK